MVDPTAATRQGLRPCARAAGEILAPALADDEAVAATFRGVRLVLGGSGADDAAAAAAGASTSACGDLVITTRRVAWLPADLAAQAFAVPFLAIDMHAVQGETAGGGPGPCVYLQLSGGGGDDGEGNGAGGGSDDDDDEGATPVGEVRLVPADLADADAIFAALCEGAALNPDPGAPAAGGGGGDDHDDGLFFDRDAAAAGAAAARLDALLVEDPARFDDPDEGEGGDGEAA